MLETILQFLNGAVGGAMGGIINMFERMLSLDIDTMLKQFPFLGTGYRIFQAVGLGLIVCIAVISLFQFFTGAMSQVKDTPIQILLRSFVGGMLIWFGNFFFEMIIELAKIPYNAMLDGQANSMSGIVDVLKDPSSWLADLAAVGIGASAILLISLMFIIIIAWNILKLMVEVCERYLMVGVLLFSSPMFYSTVASSNTAQIFKKWVQMFISQCVLMTVSVWMLKLVISGFSVQGHNVNMFMRYLLILAMCKIAQRADTYMQQLGMTTAITGGNLLGDIIAASRAFGRSSSAAAAGGAAMNGTDRKSILGASPNGSLAPTGGLFGGAVNAVKHGIQDYQNGAELGEIGANVGKNFRAGAGLAAAGIGSKAEMKAKYDAIREANPGLEGKKMAAKAMAQDAAAAVRAPALGTMPLAKLNAQRREARANMMNGAAKSAAVGTKSFDSKAMQMFGKNAIGAANQPGERTFQNPRGGAANNSYRLDNKDDSIQSAAKASGMGAEQWMKTQRAVGGVGDFAMTPNAEGKNEPLTTDTGSPVMNLAAQSAGLSADPVPGAVDEDGMPNAFMVSGPDDVVGDFMAEHYTDGAQDPETAACLLNTAKNCPPMAAEQALANPYCALSGNDEMGDALIKNAFGEETLTGSTGGTFSNIRAAESESGARTIQCTYTDSAGNSRELEISNPAGFAEHTAGMSPWQQFNEGAKHDMGSFTAAGSGEKFFVRNVSTQSETVSMPQDSPSVSHKNSVTEPSASFSEHMEPGASPSPVDSVPSGGGVTIPMQSSYSSDAPVTEVRPSDVRTPAPEPQRVQREREPEPQRQDAPRRNVTPHREADDRFVQEERPARTEPRPAIRDMGSYGTAASGERYYKRDTQATTERIIVPEQETTVKEERQTFVAKTIKKVQRHTVEREENLNRFAKEQVRTENFAKLRQPEEKKQNDGRGNDRNKK